MKKTEMSLRQILVLTVTGFWAPAIDLLPGLLAREAGRTAWLVPAVALPVLLLWVAMLGRLFRQEGSGLFVLLRQRLGKVAGNGFVLLYIVWAVWLLAEQLRRSAARMSLVYGGSGGELMAILVLLLVMWMIWGKQGGLYRAGEMFWLAMAVTVAALVLFALPQVEVGYLMPARQDWNGQIGGCLDYLNVWSTAVFAAALLPRASRKPGGDKRALAWVTVSCLGAAGLIAVTLGQMGVGLAAALPQPFLIMVQGLSLQGALTRLEAPVAALWLLADFCRMGLLLAAVREAGGEEKGGRTALLAGVAAAAIRYLLPATKDGVPGGIVLGILVPAGLWILSFCMGKRDNRPHLVED